MGERPEVDPTPVVERLLAGDAYAKLPWYTTSFFPLLYAALGRPFPEEARRKLARHMEANQAEDGYLGDHVAAAFHMAHFYRLIGEPTPRADRMVARVLRDQKPDGGWDIKEPDWDVHAGFDAVFILRQLGGDGPKVREAIARGADWALRCRNADGGFGHFPGRPSDMDAVYFQLGTLIMAGRVPGARRDLPDAHTLGWGHAMQPGRDLQERAPRSPLSDETGWAAPTVASGRSRSGPCTRRAALRRPVRDDGLSPRLRLAEHPALGLGHREVACAGDHDRLEWRDGQTGWAPGRPLRTLPDPSRRRPLGMLAAMALSLALARAAVAQADWYEPFPAHKVIGNVYYVGSKDLASYLIVTPVGHILINSGFDETVPLIQKSVESLGFQMT